MSYNSNLYNAHREFMNINSYQIEAVIYWLDNHLKENPDDANIIRLKDQLNKSYEQLKLVENDLEKIVQEIEDDN